MAEIGIGFTAWAPQQNTIQRNLIAQHRCDNASHAVAQYHKFIRLHLLFNPMQDHLCIFNLPVNGSVMAVPFAVPCAHKAADGIALLLKLMASIHHDAVRRYLVSKKSMFIKDHFLPPRSRVLVFQQADHILSPAL